MSQPEIRAVADVRRIAGAVIVSALGTWSYNVAIAVFAYQKTHSTNWVAAATVGRYVPALFITWFGTNWAGRFPRRRVAVTSDVTCAVIMAALTVLAFMHGSLLLAIGLAAISSGVARIQSSATLAVAADVVPEGRLMRVMGFLGSADAVATAVGPAIAALMLVRWSPGLVFGLNGLTFLISALFLAGISGLTGSAASSAATVGTPPTPPAVWRAVRPLIISRTLAGVIYGFDVVLLAVVATTRLGHTTTDYGWLLAAAGVGGLLGALVLRRDAGVRITAPVTFGFALYTLPVLAFLASSNLVGGILIQVARGLGCVLVTATLITSLQRAVPSGSAARVFGLTHSMLLAGTAIGAVVAPIALRVLGLTTTLIIVAIAPIALELVLVPKLLRFDRNSSELSATLDPRVTLLRRLTLFHDATRAILIEMADRAVEIHLPAQTVIVTEGAKSDALYVLVDGDVTVTALGPDGPKVLRSLSAPSYFGEIGLIHSIPRTATVTAAGPCTVWRIPAETFLNAAVRSGVSGALTESVRVRLSASAWPSGAPVAAEI